MANLFQCEACGTRYPGDLDMSVCLCGGALIRATDHKPHEFETPAMTQQERLTELLMRKNRGTIGKP